MEDYQQSGHANARGVVPFSFFRAIHQRERSR